MENALSPHLEAHLTQLHLEAPRDAPYTALATYVRGGHLLHELSREDMATLARTWLAQTADAAHTNLRPTVDAWVRQWDAAQTRRVAAAMTVAWCTPGPAALALRTYLKNGGLRSLRRWDMRVFLRKMRPEISGWAITGWMAEWDAEYLRAHREPVAT